MPTPSSSKPKRDTLNLRVPANDRSLIDRAAASMGKTRTDFILDAARRAAEEALLDRALMLVSPQAYNEFLDLLEAPAEPNDRLIRTMHTKTPW
ncbi:type II toxin-antitoxin system TacA family antitoxin [Amantichitinum ursilacus]|uniref:CopG family transcriptional regulator n=1 Tax=Amantichitinum ursilacus TaxID=857265 RepID=A0A0N0XH30_9NEIS|nr:DUF1778 domain-containing protein [Amantichitinum ursilacus]KPC50682.1 hypothetical protein WG78_16550 [Amantichitinum ursilacus]